MDDSLITIFTQFGAAGLIGLLWIFERRQAAVRDRQLEETHRRLLSQSREINMLMTIITDNTKALSSLESAQRRLIEICDQIRTTGKKS